MLDLVYALSPTWYKARVSVSGRWCWLYRSMSGYSSTERDQDELKDATIDVT